MPSLENLRKQAKLVLRWHRDRYYPVAAQIRAVLPRYRQMTDPEVLAHSFKLTNHAQQTLTKAVIIAAEPELFVADIKASLDFFTQKLGFAIAFTYGEPPFYAQVKRDGAQLNLKCLDSPAINPELRDREELLSAAMTVGSADEIKQLFLEFQSANVAFFQTLKKQPWGARNFIIKDPDGNLLLFAGPAE
jgi:catechol 2,3-dioxygenase-like lactoylglutathione lyase family enzyme